MNGSTPTISEFDPTIIPCHWAVIKDVRKNFDYSEGTHELMLSGSAGSGKSILMAHVAVTHCLFNKKARLCLGRYAMPDLKATIYQKIIEHIDGDLIEGTDYKTNTSNASIFFANGSEIISRSWGDTRSSKLRSLELSAAIVEELTETDSREHYDELFIRVGRLKHVKEKFVMAATNPDSPAHWAYKHFIEQENEMRKTYYSVTSDNPFLDPNYVKMLLKNLPPKLAERMVYGKWVDIAGEVIYYAYNRDVHFVKSKYRVNLAYPIYWTHDFNIGYNKPISSCFYQYIEGVFHFFAEIVIDGASTEAVCQEADSRGLLAHKVPYYVIQGDASGKARSTNSNRSNYDIIRQHFTDKKIPYEYQVPLSNPPIKTRHNLVNSFFRNAEGASRCYVYEDCEVLDEGLRTTKIKQGGQYIEDDSKRYQHVTTALGYGIYFTNLKNTKSVSSYKQL